MTRNVYEFQYISERKARAALFRRPGEQDDNGGGQRDVKEEEERERAPANIEAIIGCRPMSLSVVFNNSSNLPSPIVSERRVAEQTRLH